MATKQKRKPMRAHFVFNFHDQFGNGTPLGEMATGEEVNDQAFVQMVAMEPWQKQKEWAVANSDDESAEDDEFDEEITSVDELVERLREYAGDSGPWFADVVRFPVEKLKSLMDRDGWRFVSGSLWEFEGNHNDTEIHIVLERT
jgi:hypothetical protein